MTKISKELVTSIMKLAETQPWVTDRISNVSDMLDECEDECQQQLLLDMLSRFSYVDEKGYTNGLKDIVDYLFNQEKLTPSKTQVYGLQIARATDSSNEVVYRIRSLITKVAGSGIEAFSTMNRIPETSLSDRPYIVIVDEFLGSGQTAKTRLNYLCHQFKQKGYTLSTENIYLCYLAGMSEAIIELRTEFKINIYCHIELKKGIDSYYQGDNKACAYSNMDKLEEALSNPCPQTEEDLPKLGYGNAEALYFREEGNPPNSNFPIFWWRFRNTTDAKHIARNPVLVRSS